MLDVLTSLFLTRGVPRHIRGDNGPEFIARAMRRHGQQAGLEMLYIEPGGPWENGHAESFFSRLRDELLNCEEFANLAEASNSASCPLCPAAWPVARRWAISDRASSCSCDSNQMPAKHALPSSKRAFAQGHGGIPEEEEEKESPMPLSSEAS